MKHLILGEYYKETDKYRSTKQLGGLTVLDFIRPVYETIQRHIKCSNSNRTLKKRK